MNFTRSSTFSPSHRYPALSSRTRLPSLGTAARELLWPFPSAQSFPRSPARKDYPVQLAKFSFPSPSLDFLLARDRRANVPKLLSMHQPQNPVSRCKPRNEALPMFNHPALDIVRYTDIQTSSPARQDVNPICAAHITPQAPNSRSLTAVRQTQATGFGMTAKPNASTGTCSTASPIHCSVWLA